MQPVVTPPSSADRSAASRLSAARRRLTSVIGPWYPEPEAPTRGAAKFVLLGALIVAGTVLCLLRTPRAQWSTLWAEDGAVFLSGALDGGPWVLFEPYAGYMHLVPRLAIWVCTLFPLPLVPLAVTFVAALIVSAVAAACYLFLETRIRSLPLRLLAWAAVVGSPFAGGEVATNLANLHWFLMVGAVCALLARSQSVGFTVVQCVVVSAALMSDPLALLFTPFVVLRWLVLVGRHDRAVDITFLVSAVVQLAVTLAGYLSGGGRSFAASAPGVAELIDFFTYRVVLSGLFGPTGALEASLWVGVTLPGLGVAAVIAFLILATRRDGAKRYTVIALALTSLVFFLVVFRLQWSALGPSGTLGVTYGQRYAVLPAVLFVLALVVACDALIRERGALVRGIVVAVMFAVIVVPGVRDYRWTIPRADAISWQTALEAAARECEGGADSAAVPIAPEGFVVPDVDCDLVPGVGAH